jgi:hypothetical protein
MLQKLKEFFNQTDLTCEKCGKKLTEGAEVTVTFRLPSAPRMPVAALDKLIIHHGTNIVCNVCK